jgi:hypothetical protein
MKLLYGYNEEHAQPMPEGLSEEEAAKWDPFNGLDSLTEEKALEIFGEGHPIIGLEHTITMDRVKSVIQDFFSWMTAVREYRQIHDSYMELIELSEEKEIESLKEYRDKVEDPEKKEQIQKAVDLYYNRKYMDFLAEPLSDKQIGILVKAYSDEKKIGYWIERARVKLNQLKISPKVILEVAQFEKRFLPEEYHGQVNILLLHFINMVVYSDVYNKADSQRNKVVCMVFGLDKIIRNVWPAETRERIINNIITFEKQFVGKLPKPEEENVQQ